MCLKLGGVLLVPLALALDAPHAHSALAQAWPPFVLVAGLLLVGLVAGGDGLFDAAASRLVGLPGPPIVLALACFALVAVVTALLNLDTSVVFLTPVLIETARRRAVSVAPFLYGSVFMANASSLFLPGSNLTNLLVLSQRPVSGASFFTHMLATALAATLITAVGLVVIHRRELLGRGQRATDERPAALQRGLGFWGTVLVAALVVALADPALPVLAVGLILLAVRARQRRLGWVESLAGLGAPTLLALFGLSVGLGTLARASSLPAELLHSATPLFTAAVAALASVLVNNLPAAVLLSSTRPAHMGALLLGLGVGPNLAVTGSLAVLLWWRAARASHVTPSALAYSRQGLILAPLAIAGALALATGWS
jgi:arsenical pump membrane protein